MAATIGETALALLILFLAMFSLGRAFSYFARRARLPGVIGEILAGIVLGPSLLGYLDPHNPDWGFILEAVGELGIVVLIFYLGLGTRLRELRQVGRVATLTATGGVVTPLAGGTILLLAFAYDWRAALFVGAAMVATSVGITARVLADLKMEKSVPSRIIHGAAVIDDVMGMVVLALVMAVAAGRGATVLGIAWIVAAAVLFVVVALFGGPAVVNAFAGPRKASLPPEGRTRRGPLAVALLTCLAFAWIASAVSLAPIVGAFLAGVAFADVQGRYRLRRQMEPWRTGLAPFFFVLLGAKVSAGAVFASPQLLLLALTLTAVAVVTKYVPCRWVAREQGTVGARVVGVGMIPRGEVGFIVAATALTAGIVTPPLFSVVVFMAIGTSLIGPPLIRVALRPLGVVGKLDALKVARDLEGPPATGNTPPSGRYALANTTKQLWRPGGRA